MRPCQLVVPVVVAASLAACSTRSDGADSAAADTALAREAAGDLAGPATTDTSGGAASRGGASAARADTGTKRAPGTPPTTTPDRGRTTRDPELGRDGNRERVPEVPPIHRTPYPGQPNPPADAGGRTSALIAEIRSLARADGCSSTGDCQSIAIGYKACGGPRDYVVYCRATTNVAALRSKVAELERLEREASRGMASDCMMVTPPTVTLSGGVCRASSRGGAEPLY